MNKKLKQKKKTIRHLDTTWLEHRPVNPKDIILFLHGFPDTAHVWEKQLDRFATEDHIVVAPFSRGISQSASSNQLHRYGTQAQCLDMREILAEVDPSEKLPLWIVGHDLGVVYAWQCARFFGKRTQGLVVLNGMNLRQMLLRMKNPVQLAKSWYVFLMQLPVIPEWLVSRMQDKITPEAAGGIQQYRAFAREMPALISNKPKRIKCPLLVIWGNNDPYLVSPTLDELEAEAANPVVRMLESGHWVQKEKPNEVNKFIETFIGENL